MNQDRSREEEQSCDQEVYKQVGGRVRSLSLAAARRYEQIMNYKGNGAHDHSAAVGDGESDYLAQYYNKYYHNSSEHNNNNNRNGAYESHVCLANAPTPGSYNSSELTTEPTELMEESSGLQAPATDEVDRQSRVPPPASGTTTAQFLDLNIPSSVGHKRPREELLTQDRRDPRGEGAHGNEARLDDWLELRLGPSNPDAREEQREYAGDECEDATQQKSAPKHLFHPGQTVPLAGYSSLTTATTTIPEVVSSRVGDRASARVFALTGPSLAPELERSTTNLRSLYTVHASDSQILLSSFDRAGPSEVAQPLHEQHRLSSGGYGSYSGSSLFGIDGSRINVLERPYTGLASRMMAPYHPRHEDLETLPRRLLSNNNNVLAGSNPSAIPSQDWRDVFKRARPDQPWYVPGFRSVTGVGGGSSGSGGSSSWSSQLLGGSQNISTPSRMSFDFLPVGNRLPLSNPWQTVPGGLLPAFPPSQQVTADTSSSSREVREPPNGIWCSLVPVAKADVSEQLPELPRPYLHFNDANVAAVSLLKRHLVGKFGLSCESEVEISCRGRVLASNFSLQHVRDTIWKHSALPLAVTHGHTAAGRNSLMELNYSRRLGDSNF